MAKATPPTPQRASAAKKASSTVASNSRARKSPPSPSAAPTEPSADPLLLLTQRLDALEEKMAADLSTLIAEVRTLTASPQRSGESAPSDTFLPTVADLIRRSLTEHVMPVMAALKRLEERIGFISNRLKHPAGGGQERQKPWRHDQSRHDQSRHDQSRHDQSRHSRPRLHAAPRPVQGPPWSPPSAASVQGHFAPRPPFGGEDRQPGQEDEE
ncbi:MAG: hypothetical protein ACRERD_10135 [Candidatus Binatia bacterium]